MPPLDIQSITDAFSNNSNNLETFLTQSKTNFNNITNLSKEIQQELQDYKSNIENTLKQLELELEHSQPILAKWVSGSNTKLRQEQISQMRINLSDGAKKLIDKLNQLSVDLDKHVNEFSSSSQQFTANFKDLENQINSATLGVNSSQGAVPAEKVIQQAIDALNTARQGLDQRKVFEQLNRSIDNLIN